MSVPRFEIGLRRFLIGRAEILALVGDDPPRIFPETLAPGTDRPAMTYQVITALDDRDLMGPTGIGDARIQVDCYGDKYTEATGLAAVVDGLLRDFRGNLGGVLIQETVRETYLDQGRRDGDDVDRRRTLGYLMTYQEET